MNSENLKFSPMIMLVKIILSLYSVIIIFFFFFFFLLSFFVFSVTSGMFVFNLCVCPLANCSLDYAITSTWNFTWLVSLLIHLILSIKWSCLLPSWPWYALKHSAHTVPAVFIYVLASIKWTLFNVQNLSSHIVVVSTVIRYQIIYKIPIIPTLWNNNSNISKD